MSETITLSVLLEQHCQSRSGKGNSGGGYVVLLILNSLGSAEFLKSINGRVAGSDLHFRRITLVDFALENNKTKAKIKNI